MGRCLIVCMILFLGVILISASKERVQYTVAVFGNNSGCSQNYSGCSQNPKIVVDSMF